ncbi:MAG TPA: hypothetical protein VGV40_10355 [Solirubrobacteraceae bacterium]|nr:hypothetical protein [Solirubrobacteraceae bacterium]
MPPLVKPGFGPSAPDLLGRLPRWVHVGLAVVAAALVALAAWWMLAGRNAGQRFTVVPGPVPSNLSWGEELERVQEEGALLALVHRREDGLFLSSFTVRPLTLPPYRGQSSGFLPLFATFHIDDLRDRQADFKLVEEGKARVNFVPGYEVVFRAKGPGPGGSRTVYGRDVMLVPDVPGARRGVLLQLRTTPAAETPNPQGTGDYGPLRTPFRSFRLGTEPDGGSAG